MPFIQQWRRDIIDKGEVPGEDWWMPGDRCYKFYKEMVDRWRTNPRWTTAHEIFKEMLQKDLPDCPEKDDDFVAVRLAWQVFFIKHVMRYEDLKEIENGAI